MAISVPDFYRHVFQNPPDSRVPNVKGRYPQWGFKAPSKQGEITLFVWVFLLSFSTGTSFVQIVSSTI